MLSHADFLTSVLSGFLFGVVVRLSSIFFRSENTSLKGVNSIFTLIIFSLLIGLMYMLGMILLRSRGIDVGGISMMQLGLVSAISVIVVDYFSLIIRRS